MGANIKKCFKTGDCCGLMAYTLNWQLGDLGSKELIKYEVIFGAIIFCYLTLLIWRLDPARRLNNKTMSEIDIRKE